MSENPRLHELIRQARTELPSLQFDLQNASTHFSLQGASQRLFNLTAQLLYYVIEEALPQTAQSAPSPTPPAVRAQAPIPMSHPVSTSAPMLPPVPLVGIPSPSAAPAMGLPPDAPVQPGITNVFVTPQGTQVVAASGASAVLPPGEAVDLATATGMPVPPPAPPGVAQVILPPGGDMSPEVAAALSAARQAPPPSDPPAGQ